MVRAAVSGAMDYSAADPDDKFWRLKHRLILTEIQRRETQRTIELRHQHLCAYVGHGNLTPESFKNMKDAANKTLDQLENVIFPWRDGNTQQNSAENNTGDTTAENQPKNSKIDAETQNLIERYKRVMAERRGSKEQTSQPDTK